MFLKFFKNNIRVFSRLSRNSCQDTFPFFSVCFSASSAFSVVKHFWIGTHFLEGRTVFLFS